MTSCRHQPILLACELPHLKLSPMGSPPPILSTLPLEAVCKLRCDWPAQSCDSWYAILKHVLPAMHDTTPSEGPRRTTRLAFSRKRARTI